jgi:hypothetical protein
MNRDGLSGLEQQQVDLAEVQRGIFVQRIWHGL